MERSDSSPPDSSSEPSHVSRLVSGVFSPKADGFKVNFVEFNEDMAT